MEESIERGKDQEQTMHIRDILYRNKTYLFSLQIMLSLSIINILREYYFLRFLFLFMYLCLSCSVLLVFLCSSPTPPPPPPPTTVRCSPLLPQYNNLAYYHLPLARALLQTLGQQQRILV